MQLNAEHDLSLLIPTPSSEPEVIEQLTRVWSGMGAVVDKMDAAHHDLVL